ncbi:MAG: DUF5655 domain-containing protein [Microbacteriaceae bacterium]
MSADRIPHLWTCPRCARTFANRNQSHTCAPLGDLQAHFARSDPAVRALFDRILAELGPLDVLAEKSRIALHVRMSFAVFIPKQHWLDGHLVLAREAQHPLVRRVQVFSPRNVLHEFRITSPDQIDDAFVALLHEAYEVGEQHHLGRAP